MRKLLIDTALRHPLWVLVLTGLVTAGFLLQFPRMKIDTDPENMLPTDEPVRVFHRELKASFDLNDFLVLGIVREAGMFQPAPLARVAELTRAIAKLDGVIAEDLIAPTEVDDIQVQEDGALRVAPLMEAAPEDPRAAAAILERIRHNPLLRGKLASDDGQALALFIPLESKNVSYEVARQITALTEAMAGDESYYLAGQPVAQDTFGAEMFKQMAVSAPAAGGVLFLLMLLFFRDWRLAGAAMLVAFLSVIWGMGALIGLGYTVHIMSSMIPIFLLPVAILDAIHILSDVQAERRAGAAMKEAMRNALHELYRPMLFTSLTTLVGFASLGLTPIPPVQVFGAFVAFGIAAAWILSMTFLPALLTWRTNDATTSRAPASGAYLDGTLAGLRRLALGQPRWVVGLALVVFAAALAGLLRLQVNDNPVRWFKGNHPLRVADRVMNAHLAGTYIAYLELATGGEGRVHDPETMRTIEGLQEHLAGHPNVGATTSVADVVKKVGYELHLGDPAALTLPGDRQTIAQYLFLYEVSGGDPEDLFHFITPEADRANIWIQMRNGDNAAVQSVVEAANTYLAQQSLPAGTETGWGGLSYVNVIWQDLMVRGMGKALASSFVVVFLMMAVLFRSALWGIVSMLPLTLTIVAIYGLLGWVGKDYDMPVAVLSSLTLGLSIDFAIHFIQRSRDIHRTTRNYQDTLTQTFGNTGRAIVLNMLVLAIGFVPMFFATLTPYVTVGVFFFLIILVSGLATLVLLPAIAALAPGRFYRG